MTKKRKTSKTEEIETPAKMTMQEKIMYHIQAETGKIINRLPSKIGLCTGCFSEKKTITVKPHIGKILHRNDLELSSNGTAGVFFDCQFCSAPKRWMGMGSWGYNKFLEQFEDSKTVLVLDENGPIEAPKTFVHEYFTVVKDKQADNDRTAFNSLSPIEIPDEFDLDEYKTAFYELQQKNRDTWYNGTTQKSDESKKVTGFPTQS